MGHLGTRVSALLDGQLPPDEAERAWAHVHACHFCRDQVEREGWVKTRLAGLSYAAGSAPEHLKGSLLGGPHGLPPGDTYLAHPDRRPWRNTGLVAIGGGAVGAAVVGVLALGVGSGQAPADNQRGPVTHLVTPTGSPFGSPSPVVSPRVPSRTP